MSMESLTPTVLALASEGSAYAFIGAVVSCGLIIAGAAFGISKIAVMDNDSFDGIRGRTHFGRVRSNDMDHFYRKPRLHAKMDTRDAMRNRTT